MKTLPFLLFLIQLAGCASLKQSPIIYYTDQNNNRFTISRSEIVYIAIKPVESSSGTYSGGTDKQAQITSSDFKLLEKRAFEIMKNKKSHAKRREMLTAVLLIKTAGKSEKAILFPSSLRTEFEMELHKIAGLSR